MPPEAKLPVEAFCEECRYLKPDFDGILDRLDARGLDEHQQALVWCVCAQRTKDERRRDRARFYEAHLPQAEGERTFESWEQREGTEQALAAARHFTLGGVTPGLVLIGGVGSGRTHLLEAIAHVTLENGGTVRYELVKELLERLRATNALDSEEDTTAVLSYYQEVGVLLLDDLGLERANPYAVEQVTGLIDYRYRNGRRFVVTTNATKDQVAEHMGARLADRFWDRRSGRVAQVYLTATSYRSEVEMVEG